MQNQHSRFKIARRWLLAWCLFIGVGAVAGATGMLVAPDGRALGFVELLPYFQVLPFADVLFKDFLFPGIALLCVNGIPNLVAAALIIAKKKAGIVLGGIFGVTLMLWITIQFIIFPANFLSIFYFIFGIAQAATGYAALVFYKQESFSVNMLDYPNIGVNERALVVYFSRMGYAKKLAYETANASGAAVYEVKATERTDGTLGFWWCGRFAMHRWEMPIEPIAVDLTKYDKVTVVSPVWVFRLSAPMRAFCNKAAGKLKCVDYIIVHHQGGKYNAVADEMDSLLKIKRASFRSVRCRMGKYGAVSFAQQSRPLHL